MLFSCTSSFSAADGYDKEEVSCLKHVLMITCNDVHKGFYAHRILLWCAKVVSSFTLQPNFQFVLILPECGKLIAHVCHTVDYTIQSGYAAFKT